MKTFLIIASPTDLHASYVAWALEEAGYHAKLINSLHGNCPTRDSLYIDNASEVFTSADWNGAEAAWCRRLSPPSSSCMGDRRVDEFTLQEERRFFRWLVETQEDCLGIRWINSPTHAQAAGNKLTQLKRARVCALTIPRTLVTAKPERFRAFLNSERILVAKPLDNYSWTNEAGETLAAFATLIDVERGSELSDEDIGECVTLYQQRIDKVCNVRIIVMGQDVFAYRIIQNGEQHFDFRIGFYERNALSYELIPIPIELKRKITKFMDGMKIDFASADFALTPDGEFVFLDHSHPIGGERNGLE